MLPVESIMPIESLMLLPWRMDIWTYGLPWIRSFGVTGFEVVSSRFPFEGSAEPAVLDKVSRRFELNQRLLQHGDSEKVQREHWIADNPLADRRPDLSQAQKGCPEELLALLRRCWADEAEERPTCVQCMRELQLLAGKLEGLMPDNWTEMTANACRVQVKVVDEPELWTKVEERIAESLPDFRLVSLERVQNRALLRRYMAFRAELAEEHGEEAVSERELFHYAPYTCEECRAAAVQLCPHEQNVVQSIVSSSERGFIPQIGGGEYGSGSYFAQHAVYSVAYSAGWLSSDIETDAHGRAKLVPNR
jgi:hypothetical protein